MRIFTVIMSIVLSLVVAIGCGGSGESETDQKQEATEQAAEQTQESPATEGHVQTDVAFYVNEAGEQQELEFTETESGLKYADITVGTGVEAVRAMTVNMHYIGWLHEEGGKIGKKFDASYDRNAPFAFTLGQGRVIPGWEEGVLGMKQGGKRRLIIPPAIGYGERDMGVIPPNSTLVFDVEFLGAK